MTPCGATRPAGGGIARRRGGHLRAAELCAWRGLPVRLEPRDRRARRRDDDGEGRAPAALSQPDVLRAGLSSREPGDGVPRTRTGLRLFWRSLPARHLRQHEHGGGGARSEEHTSELHSLMLILYAVFF